MHGSMGNIVSSPCSWLAIDTVWGKEGFSHQSRIELVLIGVLQNHVERGTAKSQLATSAKGIGELVRAKSSSVPLARGRLSEFIVGRGSREIDSPPTRGQVGRRDAACSRP